MGATVEPRITLRDRTRLEEVIPLSTPFVLFVDPSSCCNFRCRFCPTGEPKLLQQSGRRNTIMEFSLFKKIIDDLAEFDRQLKVIRLYKDGEPFLNRNLAQMVHYARKSGFAKSIDITTNASLLSPEYVMPVIDAGIDQINISLNGISGEQIRSFCNANVDFDVLLNNIRYLYEHRGSCKILVKTVAEMLSEEDRDRFISMFSPIADKIYLEHIAPCWPSFDVEKKLGVDIATGIYGQQIQEIDVCPYVFYSMSINSDGRVSICFLDWGHNYVIGDVRMQSVKEVWDSDNLMNYRLLFLDGKRSQMPFCKDCKQLSHGMADNIDPWRHQLAQKLRSNLGILKRPEVLNDDFPSSALAGDELRHS